nr:hypothetical protein JVH1_8786 [Rhodococcus sp. JVH1]
MHNDNTARLASGPRRTAATPLVGRPTMDLGNPQSCRAAATSDTAGTADSRRSDD